MTKAQQSHDCARSTKTTTEDKVQLTYADDGAITNITSARGRDRQGRQEMISAFKLKAVSGVVLFFFLVTLPAVAQMNMSGHPKTDAQKIADALRAGPNFITGNATILDWPSSPGGEYRILRKGTNEWTCLPGVPGYSHDEPGCFDPAFMRWIKDSLAGKDPHIESVGIAYMYVGAWVPNLSGPGPKTKDFHVGPHIMIVSPHENQKELQSLSHDGSNGMPYVAHLPHGTDLYLVMPIREWDEK